MEEVKMSNEFINKLENDELKAKYKELEDMLLKIKIN